jgi:uncharacterized protein YbaP (TraB family)
MKSTSSMRRAVSALGVALFLSATAAQAATEPAMWRIKNGETTVYLFGSVHALPYGVTWRTPVIDKAITSSDVFVFEAALSQRLLDKASRFERQAGTLPRGKTISKMLSPEGLKDFKKLLSKSDAEPGVVNVMKPWRALQMLENARYLRDPRDASSDEEWSIFNGVDLKLQQEADKNKTEKRYFETAEQGLAQLAAAQPDDDMKSFEHALHKMVTEKFDGKALLSSWEHGNVAAIAKDNAEEEAHTPVSKHAILDQRNQNWLPELNKMLAEKKTFFITVGAAHLAGKGSLMELVCGEGWKVERIQTGPTAVSPGGCAGFTVNAKVASKGDTKAPGAELALRTGAIQ